jgi:hypothetical protein
MRIQYKPKSKNIVHVILDDYILDDIINFPEYTSTLRRVQSININNSTKSSVMNVDSYKKLDWLHAACDLRFKYAVVWFDGSWPLEQEFDDELIATATGWAVPWLVAGHILDYSDNGKYPKWHKQCLIINLSSWDMVGRLDWKAYKDTNVAFHASDEKLHGGYTPLFLDPDSNQQALKTSKDVWDAWIGFSLANNYRVNNIPYNMRSKKYCCYPEDDIEQTIEWLLDTEFTSKHTEEEIQFKTPSIPEDKRELWGYKRQKYQILYVTNTESVPKERIDYNLSVMCVPCSGLHQFMHISHHLDTLKRIIWFDFNPYAVQWTKIVINEWNGIDFEEFVESNVHRVLDNSTIRDDNIIYDQDLVDTFIDQIGGEEIWLRTWHSIKHLKHEFIEVDIVKDYSVIVDAVGDNESVFINLTNIWQYESNYLNNSRFRAQANYYNLIADLYSNSRELFINGNTPSGTFYECQDVKLLSEIK